MEGAQDSGRAVRGDQGIDLTKKMAAIPGAIGFPFPPPAIMGIGTSGGATFMLQDRAGKDVAFLAENTQKFIEAARKTAGTGPGHHHLPPHRAAALRGRGP